MGPLSIHISEHVEASADQVYAVASDPRRLPEWAAGLGGSIEQVDGRWVVTTDAGPVVVEWTEANSYGVLDHTVVLPTGERTHNPMRVVPHGDGAEVVFTLRRAEGMSAPDFTRDAEAVGADLVALKRLVESEA